MFSDQRIAQDCVFHYYKYYIFGYICLNRHLFFKQNNQLTWVFESLIKKICSLTGFELAFPLYIGNHCIIQHAFRPLSYKGLHSKKRFSYSYEESTSLIKVFLSAKFIFISKTQAK